MDYYKVTPQIVPADKVSEIRITPLFRHAEFVTDPAKIEILVQPFDGYMADGKYYSFDADPKYRDMLVAKDWNLEEKTIVLRYPFAGEQEYNIVVRQDISGRKQVLQFHLYSLKEDLYALRPFRGDFHIHSTGSDGREDPCYVAARYRQMGMDFCAISDHGQYMPSVTARNFWKDIHPDFKLYPGEEVHAPDNPVHIIHFGGTYSVNDIYRADEAKYRKEVQEILDAMPDKNPAVDNFAVAASEWVFRKIREAGGLSVFCHPYWFIMQYVIDEGITSEIFKRRKFDAFEILGGFPKAEPESNNHQVIRYYEEKAKGNVFPVVGVDDSHGTDRFAKDAIKVGSRTNSLAGWYSTIVFAKSDAADDLIAAIRSGCSAAVEKMEGESVHVYSDFRLTKYGTFLMRHYFPMHDVLCADEGSLMIRYLAGEEAAKLALQALRGRVAAYREQVFQA